MTRLEQMGRCAALCSLKSSGFEGKETQGHLYCNIFRTEDTRMFTFRKERKMPGKIGFGARAVRTGDKEMEGQ